MRFEKITENKIRITFSLEDLEKENIDFHTFMSNSIETQSIFLDMLNKAEKEIGFVTNNHQLMIEALATSNGHFTVNVTRISQEPAKFTPRRVSVKRKTVSASVPVLVYEFESFDDFCNLVTCLDSEILARTNKVFIKSSLFLYNNKYYLSLKTNAKANLNDVKYIISTISEFGAIIKNSSIFEQKLIEYAKVIIPNSCFTKASKFFA